MAIVASDWTITRSTGDIRYIGDDHGGASPSYATVLEFHRWLSDLADDASSIGDDELDITDESPSDRSTDNIITLLGNYNIDDGAVEHLYDGSIIQDSGNDIYDGVVNFGNVSAIDIIQNGAVLSDDWWNSGGGLNSDSAQNISHRFLIKVRSGGNDIDGRRLVGISRVFGNTYSEFSINGTSRGNNVLALSESDDLNNETLESTVSGWTDVVNNTEGYVGIDVNNDAADEFYYSEWDRGSRTINQFYERLKWLTRRGSSSTIYGLNGELFRGITHEVDISSGSGTWSQPEAVSWGSGATAGTGQMFAVNNTTGSSTSKLWLQLLTGVAPSGSVTITGGTSSATGVNSGTPTSRPVSTPFVGQSTGSAIIGSFGLGIEAGDLSASDALFDLTNAQITPPNNVVFTVSNLDSTASNEDYVLVGPEDGTGGLDIDQLSLNTTLSGGSETSVVVTTTIPTDTPSAGTVRVETDSGVYKKLSYTSYTGSTFTITSSDFSTDNATSGNNVFISYLDLQATASSENFSSVYDSDRTLFIRVRNAGNTPIKSFETTATLGSGGGSTTVIRTSDV